MNQHLGNDPLIRLADRLPGRELMKDGKAPTSLRESFPLILSRTPTTSPALDTEVAH